MTGLTVGSNAPAREGEKGEEAGAGFGRGAIAGRPSAGEGGRGEEMGCCCCGPRGGGEMSLVLVSHFYFLFIFPRFPILGLNAF